MLPLLILLPAFAVGQKWCYVVLPSIGLKDVFGNNFRSSSLSRIPDTYASSATLVWPVEQAFNVRMLVGEPGVGKTALLLRLVQQLQSTTLTLAYFHSPEA